MHLSNIISGQPFKAAVRFLFVFVIIFAAAGWLLVQSAVQTLTAEVKEQVQEETVLLNGIYQTGGREALARALRDLQSQPTTTDHSAGFFDDVGLNLAGPITLAPDFVGFANRDVYELSNASLNGEHILLVTKFVDATLVVGRSNRSIMAVKQKLQWGLAIVAALLGLAVLALGAWASRRSFQRLTDMEKSLRAFAGGDHSVRLPLLARDDQFDRVSDQMNGNLDQLERSIAAVQFSGAAIAHDLKTPLSRTQIAIHQAADACEAGVDPIPKIEEALSETENLNMLFDTMLRITNIKASNSVARQEVVDLGLLAGEVVELLSPLAETNRQIIVLAVPECSAAKVDKSMIQQLLVNLIQNAISHAGDDVEISVSVDVGEDSIAIGVSDNGTGIPAEKIGSVHDAFVRLDSARTQPGSGLGLTLCQAIVDHHNGRMILTNLNPGLNVDIELPII